jgi:hypothetical protein
LTLSRFEDLAPRRVERHVIAAKEIVMVNRTILAALVVAGATFAPLVSSAASESPTATPAPCVLRQHHVASVAPYVVEQRPIKTTFKRVAGAQLFVQAEPGLTSEWLQTEVMRHIAAMGPGGSMGDCALDVGAVNVHVSSAGAGFLVNIVAADPSKGEEVLRRARLLVGA